MAKKEIQIVVFSLITDNQVSEFGVSIEEVQEINRLVEISRLPQTPAFIEGIVNLRGEVIPVIDLKKRFDIAGGEYTEQTRILVFDIEGHSASIIVDEVSEVLRLSSDLIEKPPMVISGIAKSYIDGVAKVGERLIILLKLEKIFSQLEKEHIIEMNEQAES